MVAEYLSLTSQIIDAEAIISCCQGAAQDAVDAYVAFLTANPQAALNNVPPALIEAVNGAGWQLMRAIRDRNQLADSAFVIASFLDSCRAHDELTTVQSGIWIGVSTLVPCPLSSPQPYPSIEVPNGDGTFSRPGWGEPWIGGVDRNLIA